MEEKKFMSIEDLAILAQEKYMAMMKENRVKDLLRAIGYFPDQTITNDILILSQNPEATCVKRMTEWNYYKRCVKKAEKAIKIISAHEVFENEDFTDETGKVFSQEIKKSVADVGFIFDISQTDGKEYPYLNSNKETVAAHFEVVKNSLEHTAKEYKFEYRDQEHNSEIDKENKVVYIKDGLSVNEVINELIDDVALILLDTRKEKSLENITDFEKNAVVYAVKSKLGLDLPEFDFNVENLNDDGLNALKGNFQKVRSVTMQMLSNVENSIERAIRNLDKKIAEEQTKVEQSSQEQTTKPKRTRSKAAQDEREVQ